MWTNCSDIGFILWLESYSGYDKFNIQCLLFNKLIYYMFTSEYLLIYKNVLL